MASPSFPSENSSATPFAAAFVMPLPGTRPTPSTPSPLGTLDVSATERRLEFQISRTSGRRTAALSDLRASRHDLVSSFDAGSDDSDLEDAAILAAIAADDDE